MAAAHARATERSCTSTSTTTWSCPTRPRRVRRAGAYSTASHRAVMPLDALHGNERRGFDAASGTAYAYKRNTAILSALLPSADRRAVRRAPHGVACDARRCRLLC
jgi:hypothetical protein